MAAEPGEMQEGSAGEDVGLVQVLALKAFAWLDERFRIRNVADFLADLYMQLNMQLPRSHTERYNLRSIWYWYPMYTMGSLSALSFLVATVSGVLLTLFYVPSTAPVTVFGESANVAWQSVAYIMVEVPFGFMIRAVHFWSAMVMVAAVFIHMFRVYLTQAYKKPRELNWLVGVVLFVLTLGLGYTGYLLPWSQLAYWAATIGLEMSLSSPPIIIPGMANIEIGPWIAGFLFGGTSLGQATLTRMYIYHVFILPILTFATIGLHVTIVWIQGIAEPH
jgi:quinol-cytochrome oxidoreductase complex cytochrome b subunit